MLVLLGAVWVDGDPGPLNILQSVLSGTVWVDGDPGSLSIVRSVLLDLELWVDPGCGVSLAHEFRVLSWIPTLPEGADFLNCKGARTSKG